MILIIQIFERQTKGDEKGCILEDFLDIDYRHIVQFMNMMQYNRPIGTTKTIIFSETNKKLQNSCLIISPSTTCLFLNFFFKKVDLEVTIVD